MKVYVVTTNTDLTEGRGYEVPIAYAQAEATALRLAKGKGVQGTDASIRPVETVEVDGKHYLALSYIRILPPTDEDKRHQQEMDDRRAAYQAALDAGLSPQQIQLLRYG